MSGFSSPTNNTVQPQAQSLHISTSAQGRAIPIGWGRFRVSGNLIWYGGFKATLTKSNSPSAGKGGSGRTSGTGSYTYSCSGLWAVCEGPVNGLPSMWEGKQRYIAGDAHYPIPGGFKVGSYSQTDFSWMASGSETGQGANSLNYRGIAYWARSDILMGESPNMPDYSFEVQTTFAFNAPTIPDAKPADIVSDLLTNTHYGAAFSSAYVGDLTDFDNYCTAAGIFLSPVLDSAQEAGKWLEDLLQICNAEAIWSEGLLKVRPRGTENLSGNGATYTPDLTPVYALADDDFIVSGDEDPVRVTRTPQADAYNQVTVEFLSRKAGYSAATVKAQDQADIEVHGLRAMSAVSAHAICTKPIARTVAQILLQRSLYIRNKYEFTLGWRHCLLEPMDIVSITDAGLGLSGYLVRILEIAEDQDGNLTVTAEDLAAGAGGVGSYATEDENQGANIDFNVVVGAVNDPVIFEPPAALTGGALELWIALSSADSSWGGAQIWVSTDGTTYTQVDTWRAKARQGTLTATLASHADPDTTNTLSVDLSESAGTLTGGTTADANSYNTLCYVDGELLSYRDAALTGGNTYNLTYLRRGAYGSTIGSHGSGTKFARLDAAIFKYAYTTDRLGQTLYFKFPSISVLGTGAQSLADCTAYTYTLGGYPANSGPSGLTGNSDTQAVDYQWTNPSAASGFVLAELWVSATNDRSTATLAWSGTANRATIPESPGTYYAWVRTQNSSGNYSAWQPSGSTSGVAATASAIPNPGSGGGYDPHATASDVLMHMESGAFVDVNGHAVTLHGTVPLDVLRFKWGAGSAYFISNHYLTVAGSWSGSKFTLEGWVYFDYASLAGGTDAPFWSFGGLGLRLALSQHVALYSGSTPLGTGTATLSLGVWHYIAMTIDTGMAKVYANGVLEVTASVSNPVTATTLYLGKDESGYTGVFVGNIDEFRLSVGTVRDVTAAPAGPFGDSGPPDYTGIYEPHTAVLSAISAAVTAAADKFFYLTSSTVGAWASITSFGRSLVAAADAAATKALLSISASDVSGLGSAATKNVGTGSGDVAAGNRGIPTGGTTGQALVKASNTDLDVTWSSAGSGTVTSVATGTGLTGGPITGSGTISLANTAVTAGSYTYTNLTVDAQGRITAASNGTTPEPAISAGTTSQYWRGDKTWQTLDKTAVGLGSVENTALSAWTGSTNIATLGTITTGTWHGSVIGATYLPAMGASGVSHAAGLVPDPGAIAGTTKFLREDGTWQVPSGGGGGGGLTLGLALALPRALP